MEWLWLVTGASSGPSLEGHPAVSDSFRDRRKRLQKAREALGRFEEIPPKTQPESAEAFMLRVTGIDIQLCPRCRQGRMRKVAILPPVRGPPATGAPGNGSAGWAA